MHPDQWARVRPQAFVGGVATSLPGFWLLVNAYASTADTAVTNGFLVLAAVTVVLLLVALWFPSGRAAALGGAAGLVVAAVAVSVLSAAFGATG